MVVFFPRSSVKAVLSWLSSIECFVVAALFWFYYQSNPGCPIIAAVLAVQPRLP
jgi:hypothetical protein